MFFLFKRTEYLILFSLLFLLPSICMAQGLMYNFGEITYSDMDSPSSFKKVVDTKDPLNSVKSTEELINETVGVDVDSFGGPGTMSTTSIRGSSSNQTVLLLDGIKLSNASSQNVNLSSLPVGYADKIVITRGGASAEYGDGAVGGVINIIPLYSGKFNGIFKLGMGSFSRIMMNGFASQKKDCVKWLSSVSFESSEGDFSFTNDNNTPTNTLDDYKDYRDNNDFTKAGIFNKAAFSHKKNFKAGFSNEFHFSKNGIPGTLAFPSLHSVQKDIRNISTSTFTFNDIFKKTHLKVSLYNNFSRNRFKDPQGELTGTPIETNKKSFQFGPSIILKTYPSKIHSIVIHTGDEITYLDQVNDSARIKPFRFNYYLALKDSISLANGNLTFNPIIRFDWIHNQHNSKRNDFIVSPKFGVTATLIPGLSVKTNTSSSFRYPNFDELYFAQGFIEGNPDLENEKAINFDFGFKYETKIFYSEVVYFFNAINNLIVWEQISNFRYKPLNVGKARIQGLELSGELKPCKFLKITFNNTFMSPVNLADDPNKYGNYIPGRPGNKSNLKLVFITDRFRSFAELQSISSNFVNESNTVKIDSRIIVNSGFTFNIDENLSADIEIKNIFNNQIEDIRGFPLPGTSYAGFLTLKV